jgi:hypothetical protein
MAAIDPSVHTVEEVKAWIVANWHDHRNDSSFVAVHNAERDGKARVGLLDWLDHFAEDHDIDVTPLTSGPLTLIPTTAVYGSAPFLLRCVAPGMTVNSGITFAGGSKETTYVNPNEVTCIVDWTVITGPGTVAVWVVTDGVSTDAADFIVTEPAAPPDHNATTPNDLLTAQLRDWGISGEPVSWAPDQYQAAIVAIRAANTGYGTVATAQGVLDSSFPFNQLVATDICLAQPPTNLALSVTARDGRSRLTLDDDPQLPPVNITWLIDGNVVGHGRDVTVDLIPPGQHQVRVDVAVAGVVYNRSVVVGEPLPAPQMVGADPVEVDV